MKTKPLFSIILIAVLGLIIHKLIFFILVFKTIEDNFIYSIPLLQPFQLT